MAKYSQLHPVASAELLQSFREIPVTSLVPGTRSPESISVVVPLLPKQKTTLVTKCVDLPSPAPCPEFARAVQVQGDLHFGV